MLFSLTQEEGLILAGSTGINVAGAIRLAKELGQGTLSSRSLLIPASAISQIFLTQSFSRNARRPRRLG